MTDAFTGMSLREVRGMPLTHEATANMLFPAPGRAAVIAAAQHRYVVEVYEGCPPWRWIKRRRLAAAVDHTALVLKLCSTSLNPTTSGEGKR